MKAAMSSDSPKPPPPTEPIISSLGVIDSLLQRQYQGSNKIVVKDFWMATNPMTPNFGIHLWTWQGILRYAVSYNETFYSREAVVKFVDLVLEIIRAEIFEK